MTCDVVHCNGTFFDEHIYIEHVRHIHSDHINILSDDKCTVIEIKDASRVKPTQTGPRPASKRKVFTLLRVQCQQGKCKEENGSYFKTRAEYNKHVADIHSGKPSVKKDKEIEEKKTPDRRRLRRGRNDESLVQSTVSSPDSDGPASGSASEEDEPPAKREKPEKERLKSMMSEASFTTLLKDLDSHKKGASKTSTPIKPAAGKTSGGKVSTRRESSSSPARVSPRRKEAVKKGNECRNCRKKFGASVSKCLCAEVDVHHSEVKVKLRALNTKVVSQV